MITDELMLSLYKVELVPKFLLPSSWGAGFQKLVFERLRGFDMQQTLKLLQSFAINTNL